jgi:hypothetical protein
MQQVIISLAESAYSAAKEKAVSRGYDSVEEYVSALLLGETTEIPMTPELASAIEEGLADCRAGRVISLDELNRQHQEMRAKWILAHPV